MLKGVPIDAIDTQLQGQEQSQYPGTSAARLVVKSGNKLSVFRVKFSDDTQLTTAFTQRGFFLHQKTWYANLKNLMTANFNHFFNIAYLNIRGLAS